MESAISIIYYLLVVSACLYFIVLLGITTGWFRIKRFEGRLAEPYVPVSVIVAIRNEEKNVLNLLQHLVNQDYPKSNFEVILIDDHSEDKTVEVVESFLAIDAATKVKLIHASGIGKKSALSEGRKIAKGELIMTTDGDCVMGPEWISRMVSFYQAGKPALIIGPVVYRESKGIAHQFFSLDFMSLVASGAGSAGIHKPIMGNGANLVYEKTSLGDLMEGEEHASGDDVFLIQQMAKEKGSKSIQFIRDPEAIVVTEEPSSCSEFFNQRMRWTSKAIGYQSEWAIAVAVVVFLFNIMLVATLIASFFKSWMVIIFGLFVVFKTLVDLPLLNEFTAFVNRRKSVRYLPLFEFFYPFYIVFAAIAGLFFKFEWKGRKDLR